MNDGQDYSGNDVRQVVMYCWLLAVIGSFLFFPHVIRRIMEIQAAVFGFVNGNRRFQWVNLEVLDGRYIRIGKFPWKKIFDEMGTVISVIIFLVHETLGYVPYEMAKWNIGVANT